jgi:two-component system NarL family sensor kinase
MTAAHENPLLTAIAQLRPHDHLCSIYESPEERFAVAIPFIRTGLDRGERCIYVADDADDAGEAVVREALATEGIDVERAIATDRLVLGAPEDSYLRRGSFDAESMLAYWADATAEATRLGFPVLRIAGEMGWVLRGAPGVEGWREYESRLTRMLAQHNCLALCQYSRSLSPPELILDVIRTHPSVIYRADVYRNMYHVPPDELLVGHDAAREADRLLSNIREREEVESTLRQQRNDLMRSEGLLRLVLDALPVGVAVVDRSGDISLTNPASERIWAGSVRPGARRYAQSKAWWPATGRRLAPDEWASARALSSGEITVGEILEIETFDGVRKVIENSAVPIRDADGHITGAVIVNQDVSASEAAQRELKDAYDRMRALTGRLMRAQDDERRRIARMLHETTAQNLAALKMLLARLNLALDGLGDGERQVLAESTSLAERSMTEIRTLSYLLHPPFLDETGLPSALRWYAGGFAQRSGIKVDLDLPESYERPSPEAETALFRVVQESLINIHRHSGSETARIRMRSDPETLVLEIEDQGHGIASTSLERILSGGGSVGVGIAGMSERIKQLGGRLDITSDDGGTTVRAQLPLARGGS